jgi:endoglucanase
MVEGCPDDLGEHSVYVDNFVLKLTDDSNIVIADDAPETMDINVNQVGYRPSDTKKAIIRGEGAAEEMGFSVINVDTGESVFSAKVSNVTDNEASGEQSAVCDFSQVTTEGNYKIVSDKSGESATFTIAENVYDDLLKDTLKMLYLQRCGEELTQDLAGDFAHSACHTSEATIYGTSTKKDVSGGWHDAGDYGRYTVSGAKAVADLMLAYENHSEAFDDALGIPESGNGVADILDEARYELEWLLKMQDETSGGVYHKVTAANFPETVMPQEEVAELLLLPISNAATGDFAAVMAMAGRIYQDVDSDFANTCIKASKRAIDYINSNEDDGFQNPTDVATGEYPDTTWYDEQLWALTEYYKTTGDKEIHKQIQKFDLVSAPNGLGWQAVGYYALYAYLSADNTNADTVQAMKERLQYSLQTLFSNAEADIYESTLSTNYMWGSNMAFANNAMILDLVMNTPAYLTDSSANPAEYKALAAEQVNYLLGKNSTSYCFVTGYGTLSPENPHHRPSQVLEQAMKGMLVGGADSNLEDPYAKATMQDTAPAKCYADNAQSYSCNEVTVYWNSPLVYALSALQ